MSLGLINYQRELHFFLYSNKKMASENDISKASNYQLLNGVWRFNWVRDSEERPKDFYKNDYDISSWKSKNILKHLFFQ